MSANPPEIENEQPGKARVVDLMEAMMQSVEAAKQARMARGVLPSSPNAADDTPDWAYDEDGYCVCCGNGRWKHHNPECELRDALDAAGLRSETTA